jgi:hypothetical protein
MQEALFLPNLVQICEVYYNDPFAAHQSRAEDEAALTRTAFVPPGRFSPFARRATRDC